jgi:hypothetical protein
MQLGWVVRWVLNPHIELWLAPLPVMRLRQVRAHLTKPRLRRDLPHEVLRGRPG